MTENTNNEIGIREQLKEIVKLQEQYLYALRSVKTLLTCEKEFDSCLDVLEQVKEFVAYVFQIKSAYYGRSLDWTEEYLYLYAEKTEKLIAAGQYEMAAEMIPHCINVIQKSKEELEEILQTGTYDVNLGKMQLKKGVSTEEFANRDQMIEAIDPDTMNPLEKFFFQGKHHKMTKWCHYFEVYHRHFERFRNNPVTILEIGVWGGGSLQMWKDYFGESCRIIGIDIMEECKNYEEERIKIYIGSQEDRDFLKKVKHENPKIDIIIDDGGHTMNQQIVTFEELYPHLSENGVYLCEDLMTSYWPSYGGGRYMDDSSFIGYSKNFIDKINARYSLTPNLKIDRLTSSIRSVHYYDAMLVLEKGVHKPSMVL